MGLLALLAAGWPTAAGCGDAGTAPSPSLPPGTMAARINGRWWSSSTLLASRSGPATLTLQGVSIVGTSAEQISITLNGIAGPDSYRLGDDGSPGASIATIVVAAPDGSGRTLGHNAGTVTLTRLTPDGVEGRFAFEAGSEGKPKAWVVTDGIFNARLR